ncbi:MAG: hypothetical protein HY347_04805 [candidate division NC10 bacterium]|nr:hypothetical protein [candidate division NC10 bacterium]
MPRQEPALPSLADLAEIAKFGETSWAWKSFLDLITWRLLGYHATRLWLEAAKRRTADEHFAR